MRRSALAGIVLVAGVAALTSCSSGASRYDGEAVDSGYIQDQYEESQQHEPPIETGPPPGYRYEPTYQPAVGVWSCVHSPTYNDDWHDDYVCSNGAESHRPYLREWDAFVEDWEMEESVAEYEAQLNAGS